MPGLKSQEHIKIERSIGMTPAQLVECVKK